MINIKFEIFAKKEKKKIKKMKIISVLLLICFFIIINTKLIQFKESKCMPCGRSCCSHGFSCCSSLNHLCCPLGSQCCGGVRCCVKCCYDYRNKQYWCCSAITAQCCGDNRCTTRICKIKYFRNKNDVLMSLNTTSSKVKKV